MSAPEKSTRRNSLIGAAFSVTLFVVLGQAVGVLTQMVIAANFGAGEEMDAFFVASTLPQFIGNVLLNALVVVFIPIFVESSIVRPEEDAWRTASSVITLTTVALALVALTGMLFSGPLVNLVAPGLSSGSFLLASRLGVILWPTVLFSGAVSLLSSIYQAKGHFTWPAVVPAIGAALNVLLILALVKLQVGVETIAISMTLSFLVQALLLWPITRGNYRVEIDWDNPGMRRLFALLWPLLLSSLVARVTPVVDRYLASGMPAGSISHLGYAYKIIALLSTFMSSGIATVLLPRMASEVASGDMAELRSSFSRGFRMMWLMVAPVIAVGCALAYPVTALAFQRGAFTPSDSLAVSQLLQIYLFALVGMCLGSITGRTFYALKKTRLIAVLGGASALAYVAYAPLLAHAFGVAGIACACVFLFNFDVTLNVLVIRAITGRRSGAVLARSFLRTTIAASLGGLVTWCVTLTTGHALLQILLGGPAGIAAYVLLLVMLGSTEIRDIVPPLSNALRTRFAFSRSVGGGGEEKREVLNIR